MDREKWCPVCKRTRPAAAFRRNRTRRGGLTSQCRTCVLRGMADREWAAARGLAPALSPWLNLGRDTGGLIENVYRAERRADLAEIGGLEGVHEIRRRIRAAGRAKAMLDGAEVPAGMIEEMCC